MEQKLKYLEFIQQTITRMASNSFMLKGWGVTIVSALLVFLLGNEKIEANPHFFYITLVPLIAFWYLDSYFLRQEKLFRQLFEKVRVINGNNVDFSMKTTDFTKDVRSIVITMFSRTLLAFYGTVIITVVVIIQFIL